MAIILVRHAETALNVARTLQPFDTPLSARGLEQAASLAQRVARQWRPAMVVSSDAPRARQTAEPIAALCGLDLRLEQGLRERDFGALRGQPYDGMPVDPLTMEDAPPGGESLAEFRERSLLTLDRLTVLARSNPQADLVLVSHGLWIRAVIEARFSEAPAARRPLTIANTSVTLLVDGPPWRLEWAGCTAHLEPEHAPRGIAGL